jgi:hypothetical protein
VPDCGKPLGRSPRAATPQRLISIVKSRPEVNTPDLQICHIEAPYLSEVTDRYAVENVWSISPGLAPIQIRNLEIDMTDTCSGKPA